MLSLNGFPLVITKANVAHSTGHQVQKANIEAAKVIADLIRSCLGPKSMLKMLMDPMGGIVMTNDGNAILREIIVNHPAGKTLIEIARTQDEEVGDGTTSVIILAAEFLKVAGYFLFEEQMHPIEIIRGLKKSLDQLIPILDNISIPLDRNNKAKMLEVIDACLNTKFLGRWSKMACQIALNAIDIVYADTNGRVEIDIKRYIRIEKIPGDNIENSYVLPGIMIGKDIIHPQMRRYIENPKILLLDCPLEYKKLESQTNVEMLDNQGLSDLLQLEEMYIGKICSDIIAMKPDVVFCEKGISDLALHYLVKANISALRRVRKSDNNRLARACGATIVHRTDELQPFDIGTKAGLFEIKKIGDEYFTYVTKCEDPKACTIILRGPSKDVLNEAERNLQDALNVARNLMLDPRILPGGGAVEMEAAKCLQKIAPNFPKESPIFRAVAKGLEIIPLTLASNCGSKPVRVLTKLRATHARGLTTIGIDGITGKLTDMTNKNIWEPLRVKSQIYKSAIESCNLLLRIDEILSGVSSKAGTPEKPPVDSKKE